MFSAIKTILLADKLNEILIVLLTSTGPMFVEFIKLLIYLEKAVNSHTKPFRAARSNQTASRNYDAI